MSSCNHRPYNGELDKNTLVPFIIKYSEGDDGLQIYTLIVTKKDSSFSAEEIKSYNYSVPRPYETNRIDILTQKQVILLREFLLAAARLTAKCDEPGTSLIQKLQIKLIGKNISAEYNCISKDVDYIDLRDELFGVQKKVIASDANNSSDSLSLFRANSLKTEFKDFILVKLADTIVIDLNGDKIHDVAVFTQMNDKKGILVTDGKTKAQTKIGLGKSFGDMGDDFSWVDYWGIVNDKSTYDAIIQEDEVVGQKETTLEHPSIFVRKDEAGGGVITFKNNQYVWVHQSD